MKLLESNLKASSIELGPEDINAISSLNRNFQTCFWKKFVKLQNIEQYNDVPLVKPISAHVSLSVLANDTAKKEELVAEYLDYQAKL